MKLNELLMCQGVARWHIVEMSRDQSVAEHSFNVAMIVVSFMEKLNLKYEEITPAICLALMHDVDEVFEGDIPSIAKKEPVLKDTLMERSIQVADKLEAAWFAHHYAIGPRADTVKADTRARLFGLVNKSSPEEITAWARVREEMEYMA